MVGIGGEGECKGLKKAERELDKAMKDLETYIPDEKYWWLDIVNCPHPKHQAETLEDLLEWKTALEEALANAPSVALMVGQNGVFRNDQANGVDASSEQYSETRCISLLLHVKI